MHTGSGQSCGVLTLVTQPGMGSSHALSAGETGPALAVYRSFFSVLSTQLLSLRFL